MLLLLFLTDHKIGTEDKEENLQIERTRCIYLIDSSNCLNAFLKSKNMCHVVAFICPLKRYTSERKRFLADIVSNFDDSHLKRFFVIVTQSSKEHQAKYIRKELENVSKVDGNMDKILSNGYLVCPDADYNKDLELCQQFRNQFVDMIYLTAIRSLTPIKAGKRWPNFLCR